MRSSFTTPMNKFIAILCAVALCCGFPASALADQSDLLSIPGGSQGASRIASSAEEVGSEVFSHYPSDDAASSVDAGGAAHTPEEGIAYINEDVPLANTVRGFAEVDLTGDDAAAEGALEGAPKEAGETSVLSLENASTYAAAQHRIYFDPNGGTDRNGNPYVFYGEYFAAQGTGMPNISGELDEDAPPYKANCTFMGFYDGSDYTRANKYYDANFQPVPGMTYPADAEGLTLYAGFAPILKVTVPLRVSIAMGTVDELGAPTVASAEIRNASPWPVVFTDLKWEKDDGTPASEAGVLAASETVNSLLANKVELAPSTMEAMFTDPGSLTLKVTANGKTVSVPYGGSVKLASDAATNPLYLEEAPSTLPSATGEKSLAIEFAIDKGSSSIKQADAVAETRLLSAYEAVTTWGQPTSHILFDLRGAEGGQVSSLPATLGSGLRALTVSTAPFLNGYDFLGYADKDGKLWYEVKDGAIVPVADPWSYACATVLHPVWNTKDCLVEFWAGPAGSPVVFPGTTSNVFSPQPALKYGQKLSDAFRGSDIPTPSWAGYEFLGWYDGDTQVNGDTEVSRHEGTTVIKARWKGAPVTVTWDVQAAQATYVGTTNHESGSGLGSLPTTSRPGYTFSGWHTREGGQGSSVTADTVVYENETFYAAWTANYVNVSFVVDGTVFPCSPQLYDDGTVPSLVPPANLPNPPLKEGHTFLGWYERYADGTLSAERLDPYATPKPALPANDTVYAAKWAAHVTFSANGGSFASGETDTVEVTVGSKLGRQPLLLEPENKVSREGYVFTGWFTAAQGGSPVDMNTIVEAPVTFFAHWDALTYSITYDLAGGEVQPADANPSSYTPDDEVTLQAPARSGYEFTGWSGTGLTGEANLMVTIATGSTGNRSYTAHWKAAPYKITYELSGGVNPSANPSGYGVDSETITLQAPTRAGYDFAGWSGTDLSGNANMTVTIPKGSLGDRSFTAHWTPITYTISFAPDNVNRSQELLHRSSADPVTYTIESDDFTLAVPTSTNYDFVGWSGEGLAGTDTREVTIPKGTIGNKTYTANWAIKTFTVSYNAILADAPENWPQTSERVEYGAGITLTSVAPTRESFNFRGWSEVNDPSSTTAQYLSGQALTPVVRNMELYAVWAWCGTFYLDLTAAQASAINAASGEQLLDVKQQRLDAKTIKNHATDISNNSTNSRYYKMYDYILKNDIRFIANWQNVTAQNHKNKSNAPEIYVNSGFDYSVRLIGLDQDYLTANKSGKRAGMTFQFGEKCLTYWYTYNKTDTNEGGWKQSQLRAVMNSSDASKATQATLVSGDEVKRSSIYDRAPKVITDNIQPVYKFTHNEAGNINNTASAVSATLDQFFLTSYGEMASTNNAFSSSYQWIANEAVYGNQYQFFVLKNISGAEGATNESLKKYHVGSPDPAAPSVEWKGSTFWWQRTVNPGSVGYCKGSVILGGINSLAKPTQGSSIAPAFCF